MMLRVLEYTLMFIVAGLLQIFLFNNLSLSVYINPLVYIVFILLLPIKTSGGMLLLLAMLMGVTMDLIMGTAGINTIATLLSAFMRNTLLILILGAEDFKDGGVPNMRRLGISKYLRYSVILIFIHSFVFFSFESLTLTHYYLTLFRIVLSASVTTLFVYFFQLLFVPRG